EFQIRRGGAPTNRRNKKAKTVRFNILLATALFCSGCAGYRLGQVSDKTAGARSVQVNPFTTKLLEPRVSDAVTASLRKQLQRDGTYRLDTKKDGEIILSGTII